MKEIRRSKNKSQETPSSSKIYVEKCDLSAQEYHSHSTSFLGIEAVIEPVIELGIKPVIKPGIKPGIELSPSRL